MLQSKQVAAKMPLPEPISGVHPVVCVGEYVVGSSLPVNSIIEMTGIPPGTFPVDVKVVGDDCDSNGTPTIAFSAGILSGLFGKNDDTRTIGTEFAAAGTTTLQAGGVFTSAVKAGLILAPTTGARGVGIKITAAAATLVAGSKIRMYVTCHPDPGSLT